MIDIIIVGAGAAGLSAARTLGKTKKVLVLEARDRIGGRIHTVHDKTFSVPIEYGAEFIHGDLPVTKSLLEEASIKSRKGEGKVWNVYAGKLSEGEFYTEGWDDMLAKLKALQEDISINEFLQRYFNDEKYKDLRESVVQFVSGYDAADPEKASALSLRDEWLAEEDLTGYHPEGGYGGLINFLYDECLKQNVTFKLNQEVVAITWKKGEGMVMLSDGSFFEGRRVLITVPPAVLKAKPIIFSPDIPQQLDAIQKIETGGVIKFVVEFKEAYWEKDDYRFRTMNNLHFLFSDAEIPTWWTQKPKDVPLLTGWLAGPVLKEIDRSPEALLARCQRSLMYLLNCSKAALVSHIRGIKIIDWSNDPLAGGAYAYRSVEGNKTLKILSQPIQDTIYFAGEAYYDGPAMGTVEAAFQSSELVARNINGDNR
ncbi:flavin monoamine oxidase family protein [Pseudochryseolinea flava]|uniref:Tryptophan 2-monooxygenase n=1 Tax=Pseudochryseolinea flava TaxID=2059302 RepID=A0A364Y7W0_9BACT|nr:NAD(P)/FAD-dependent oxidoreductase [Pseudochryseolinea flava]RAW03196.1 hypothetical protein DQQ10_03665 [Pseudochryseolinea flava]